jgi:predicted transposase YdaD
MSEDTQQQQDNQQQYQNPPQAVDASMKGLVEQQAHQMLPYLVAGAIYQETLNIEIIRPPMRADRVYRILYQGQPHILHLEFQTSHDADLPARLLVYCSVLYQDHKIPIISVVIYPFSTTTAEPPLSVMSGEKEVLKLDYRILLLFEEDATTYVRAHAICMYPLLPAMKQVDAPLIKQVAEEMKAYYGEQETVLADQFAWMRVFFRRTTTITPEEKQKIEEVFKMLGLEKIWDESPLIQEERAHARAEGKMEGIAEGESRGQLEGLRLSVEMVVNARFPSLTNLARLKVASIMQIETLSMLLKQITTAPNEETARWLLLPQQEPS